MAKKKVIIQKKFQDDSDKIPTFQSKLFAFIGKYKIHVSCALIAVIVSITAFVAVQYFSNKAEDKAFAMLEQCVKKYEALLTNDGKNKACFNVAKDFNSIFEKYSKKQGGKLAKIVYANICYEAGNFDKAMSLYNDVLQNVENNWFLKNLILNGLGYAHEEKKDYKMAIKYFEMITKADDSIMKSEALYNLGRIYEMTGDKDKSINAFKKIIPDYSNESIYLELIQEKI